MNVGLQLLYTATRIRKYLINNPDVGPVHECVSKIFFTMEIEALVKGSGEEGMVITVEGENGQDHSRFFISVQTEEFVNQLREINFQILLFEMSDAN